MSVSEPEVRLIPWTGERIPPAGLLARLRAIHPQAELVDAGADWWLGIVEPTKYRRATGARLLDRARRQLTPDPESERLGQLMVSGFALVATYPAAIEDAVLVEDFRRRCWQHDHDPTAGDFFQALREAAKPRATRRAEIEQEMDALVRERATDAVQLWTRRPLISVPGSP